MDDKKVLNLIGEILQTQVNTHKALAATLRAMAVKRSDKVGAQALYHDLAEYLDQNLSSIEKSLQTLSSMLQEAANAE